MKERVRIARQEQSLLKSIDREGKFDWSWSSPIPYVMLGLGFILTGGTLFRWLAICEKHDFCLGLRYGERVEVMSEIDVAVQGAGVILVAGALFLIFTFTLITKMQAYQIFKSILEAKEHEIHNREIQGDLD